MAKREFTSQSRSTKVKFPYQRNLKVRSGAYVYPARANRDGWYLSKKPVPWLYVKGYWLKEAGFQPGMPVSLKVSKRRIVITVTD